MDQDHSPPTEGQLARDDAYDMIDHYLRNNLDDAAYAEYSAALDRVYAAPTEFEQWAARVDRLMAERPSR